LLLSVMGRESLTIGVDFPDSTASNAAFAEHLAQLRVPEGLTVEKPSE